nr:unnamed protein product [Callosobruchus chinensis]
MGSEKSRNGTSILIIYKLKLHITVDNQTAISCIIKAGSIKYPHLNEAVKELWQWCKEKSIIVYAGYIPSSENKEVDKESRSLSYLACFRKYWQFCNLNQQDPFVYNLGTYLGFLTEMLSAGNSYSVLNSYRSALNLIYSPISPSDEKIICRGVFNRHPPRPKYDITWNPDSLLDFLEKLYPLHTLSLEKLTYKLVTLMALVTASSAQILTLIEIENIQNLSDRIEIKIPHRIKTSGQADIN